MPLIILRSQFILGKRCHAVDRTEISLGSESVATDLLRGYTRASGDSGLRLYPCFPHMTPINIDGLQSMDWLVRIQAAISTILLKPYHEEMLTSSTKLLELIFKGRVRSSPISGRVHEREELVNMGSLRGIF